MTPHFTFNNGAIRSGGNARSLESLLLQAQQLEIASRTTPNDYVQTKRADLRDCWRKMKEMGR